MATKTSAGDESGVGVNNWKYRKHFGDAGDGETNTGAEITEADLLTVVEFDRSGEYLAAGDKGGCICIFKASTKTPELVAKRKPLFWKSKKKKTEEQDGDFEFHVDFQSHEPEFDYLKSLEIEEKINKIRWCHRSSRSMMLLSTNDKTIKLWKVYEKQVRAVTQMNHVSDAKAGNGTTDSLRVPNVSSTQRSIGTKCKRKYINAHQYHINSISLCSDGQTFLSADDLRVNIWDLNRCDRSFNIVDIKPENMEELTEVITSAVFHPYDCQTFMYSSSCGKIMLGDLRAGATCDATMKCLYKEDDSASNSFFSEIIASISDIKFSGCGRYALSRNYLGVKVWDLAMDREPVVSIDVSQHLQPKLCELYESDCIFDKFELAVCGEGDQFCTGSYHNLFHVFKRDGTRVADLKAEVPRAKDSKSAFRFGRSKPKVGDNVGTTVVPSPDDMDFNQKVLHVAWHPKREKIALASKNMLYIYSNEGKGGR